MLKPLIALLVLSLVACTNAGNAPGDTGIPKVTGAVKSSTTGVDMKTMTATVGAPLASGTCSVCGNGTNYNFVYTLASMFVVLGKSADTSTCVINALAESNLVPGMTSGLYQYLVSGSQKIKIAAHKTGDVLSSFELFICDSGSQSSYIKGTNVGGIVGLNMRVKASGMFSVMNVSGDYQGSTWGSKSLIMSTATSNQYTRFTITQNTDYLDVTGAIDVGTLGTLDSNDVRLFSRVELLGTNPKTYALGSGSILIATGTGSQATSNWDGDSGIAGFSPGFDSVVASASLPAIPLSAVATDYQTSETWDCSVPSGATPVDFSAAASTNAGFSKSVQNCTSGLQ